MKKALSKRAENDGCKLGAREMANNYHYY